MNPDGTSVRRLAPRVFAGSPTWSPDATQIVFEGIGEADSDACDEHNCAQIWVVDADGENARRVWSVGIGGTPFGIDWAAARD
jgi:Tol biopolymer transport system component